MVFCAEARRVLGARLLVPAVYTPLRTERGGRVAADRLGLDGPGKVDGAASVSQNSNVLSFRFAGLAILANIVAHLLTVGQGAAEADGRDVNEDVWAAVVWGDEAEALIVRKI
ncbi:hypothetical protein QE435_000034 [Rhizobium sp. SORGH_AS 787]|nr:hypothetical protein [Rhizobium sp. SORGH_AS_0787]